MAAYWEKIVHCVVERVGHGPVYKVQPQTGNRFSVCVTETYLLGITEKTREKTQAQPKKKTLKSRIPCYRLVRPHQQGHAEDAAESSKPA